MPAEDFTPDEGLGWLYQSINRNRRGIEYINDKRNTTPWITPTLLNSFAAPSAPKKVVQYRFHSRLNSLEFRGYVNVASASSNTVAFVLLQPFWPANDMSTLADIVNGISFSIARFTITASNGQVKIIWPAT